TSMPSSTANTPSTSQPPTAAAAIRRARSGRRSIETALTMARASEPHGRRRRSNRQRCPAPGGASSAAAICFFAVMSVGEHDDLAACLVGLHQAMGFDDLVETEGASDLHAQ